MHVIIQKSMILSTRPSTLLHILPHFLFLLAVVSTENNIFDYEDQAIRQAKFNYNPNSNIGPPKWANVDTSKSEYHAYFGNQKENTCDGNMQSPVKVEANDKCKDDHRLHFTVSKDMSIVC